MSVVPVPVFPVSGTTQRGCRNALVIDRRSFPFLRSRETDREQRNARKIGLTSTFPRSLYYVYSRASGTPRGEAYSRVLPLPSDIASSYSFRNLRSFHRSGDHEWLDPDSTRASPMIA